MPSVERSTDVVEIHSETAIRYGFVGIPFLILSAILIIYRGESGMFVPLAIILIVIGLGLEVYGFSKLLQIRKVTSISQVCPYCEARNLLTEPPADDFRCVECNRLIPILDQKILPVNQVRCGFCNELNYYSEKTDVLLCEKCNHEVPIAHDEGHVPKKKLGVGYAVHEDDRPYELVLVAHGPKTEDLVHTLQTMLALNRNQVKQMLTELPVTLLTGIPKKKAEMLRAQLSLYDAAVDLNPLSDTSVV